MNQQRIDRLAWAFPEYYMLMVIKHRGETRLPKQKGHENKTHNLMAWNTPQKAKISV